MKSVCHVRFYFTAVNYPLLDGNQFCIFITKKKKYLWAFPKILKKGRTDMLNPPTHNLTHDRNKTFPVM